MSSFNDRDKINDLMLRIVELNKSINLHNDKLTDITQDPSFPTEALAKEALSLNQQSFDELILLQELVDAVELLNKQEFDDYSEKLVEQKELVQEAKSNIDVASINYKKTRTSYYTLLAIFVSAVASSMFIVNFQGYEIGDSWLSFSLTAGAIIISLASNYLSLREARRGYDLANEFYELRSSHLKFFQDQIKSIDEQATCLDSVKSHTTNTLKCYRKVQKSIMKLYEVRFNG